MSQRFFAYPVVMLAVMLLVPVLQGRDRRWHAAQIAQLGLVILAGLGAIYFDQDIIWVFIAWGLLVGFVLTPKILSRLAWRWQTVGHWARAARLWDWTSRFAWGHIGQIQRRYAGILTWMAQGRREDALAGLDDLEHEPMPAAMRGNVRVWKLALLCTQRDWSRAISFYESVEDWATSLASTRARLLAARAYAEAGHVARGLQCLQFVALSPRTLGALETQFSMTRVRLAAIAGDTEELATLLRERRLWLRGAERFAAYWRGRCAYARGDRGEAVRLLTRALSLTDVRDVSWRDAIQYYLDRAQRGAKPTGCADNEDYRAARHALHAAEAQTAAWRGLMHFGRPEWATVALVVVCASVFVGAKLAFGPAVEERFWLLAGNGAETVQRREWWRLVTTLFVHANWLHLLMNGVTLWMFGSSIERTMGRWRFLAIFVLAGAAGNLLSALHARYDVAVGASAGIFGLVGAFVVAVWRLDGPIHATLRRRLLALLALTVTSDLAIGWLEPLVDNVAHAGGFIAGIALTSLLQPTSIAGQNRGR